MSGTETYHRETTDFAWALEEFRRYRGSCINGQEKYQIEVKKKLKLSLPGYRHRPEEFPVSLEKSDGREKKNPIKEFKDQKRKNKRKSGLENGYRSSMWSGSESRSQGS